MRNIDRREPSATYPMTGWITAGNIMQRKFNFNQGTPVAWIPNVLTSYTIQDLAGTTLAFTASWSKWAKVEFSTTNALPSSGWSMRIEWPSEFPDQQFCPCWAYDDTVNVDYACDCSTENKVWAITPQTAIGVNAGNAIRVVGYVKAPASATVSGEIEITTYDGAMANDFRVDRDETSVTITTLSIDATANRPAQLLVPSQFETKQPTLRKLIRDTEKAPFTFNFTPTATGANLEYEVKLGSDFATVSVPTTKCRVVFYDKANNTRHGSICKGDSLPDVDIYWPSDFSLDHTKVYEVQMYTVGDQTHTAQEGITFPGNTVFNTKVILNHPPTAGTPTHTTSTNYQTALLVEATSKWKVQVLSAAAALNAWPKITFQGSIPIAANGFLAFEFPIVDNYYDWNDLFENDLDSNFKNGADAGCGGDHDQTACILDRGVKATQNTNNSFVNPRLRTSGHTASTNEQFYWLPNVKNPTTANKSVDLIVYASTISTTNENLSNYFVMEYAYTTKVDPSVTATTINSYLNGLSGTTINTFNNNQSIAGQAFTLANQMTNGASEFIIVKYPHVLAATGITIESTSPVDSMDDDSFFNTPETSDGVTITNVGYIIAKINGATANALTLTVGGFTNPGVTMQNPTNNIYIFKDQLMTEQFDGTLNPNSFTAQALTSVTVTPGNLWNSSIVDYTIEVQPAAPTDGTATFIKNNAAIKIDFTGWTTLHTRCEVNTAAASIMPSLTNTALSCTTDGTIITVKNIADTDENKKIIVRVFAQNPNSPGTSYTVKAGIYTSSAFGAGELMEELTSSSFTLDAAIVAPTTLTMPYFALFEAKTLARGDNTNVRIPVSFEFKPSAQLTKEAGFIDVDFTTGVFVDATGFTIATDAYLRCFWRDTTTDVRLGANQCISTGIADRVTVYAPQSTDILTTKTYEVIITTVNGANLEAPILPFDGLQPHGTPKLRYSDVIITADDGTTQKHNAYGQIFLCPAAFAAGSGARRFNRTASQVSAMQFDMLGATAVAQTDDLIIEFETAAMGTSLGLGLTGDNKFHLTDCWTVAGSALDFSAANLATCNIQTGISGGRGPAIHFRKWQVANLVSPESIILPGYVNPVADNIISVKIYARTWSTDHWAYLFYSEFDYVDMTEADTPTAQTAQTISLGSATLQDATTITLPVIGTNTVADSAAVPYVNRDRIVFSMTETDPVIPLANSHASYTVRNAPIRKLIWVEDTGNPITLSGTVNVALGNGNSWTNPTWVHDLTIAGMVWTGLHLSDTIAYTYPSHTAADLNTDELTRKHDTNFTGQDRVGRTPEFQIEFKTDIKVIVGGAIHITAPTADFTQVLPCRVIQGLAGSFTCVRDGTNARLLKITGFDEYDGASDDLIIIIVQMDYVTTLNSAQNIGNFRITTYADSTDTTTIIEDKTDLNFGATVALNPWTPGILDVSALRLIQTELEACLSDHAEIKMNLTPSTALARNYILDLKPNGTGFEYRDMTATPLTEFQALFSLKSNPTNFIPSPKVELKSTTRLEITVPHTYDLSSTSTEYQIWIRMNIKDGAAVLTQGIATPTGDLDPILNYFELQIFDATPTLVGGGFSAISDDDFCASTITGFTITPGFANLDTFNYFTISLTNTVTVAAGGHIDVEFPTHDGVDEIFAQDLGVGITGTATTQVIDCSTSLPAGTGDTICTVHKSSAIGTTTPAIVRVTGFGAAAGSTYSLVLVKIKNPVKSTATILTT